MSTTTIDDQLAELHRRVDRLQAFAAAVGENARTQRHVDVLRRQEAAVLAAIREAPDDVEEKLGQLKTRLSVAEQSLTADMSDGWGSFAEAVEDELRSWDTYLERLQATDATRAWKAREQAEAAIGDIRSRRIAIDERLAQARGAVGDGCEEQRNRVTAARDELERKADQLSAKLD